MRRKTGFLRRPDAEIYYEVTGEGPALVFAHGLGGNHLSWWQQVPHFADRYSCVTFAHRGFTPSRIEPGGARAEAYGDDLAALADHLGFKTLALVCQSMGGWTGLDFAFRAPERVSALVLASTSGRIDYKTIEGPESTLVGRWLDHSATAIPALQAAGIHVAMGARGAREQPALHFLYQEIDALTPAAAKDKMRESILALRDQPATRLRDLRVPLLYVVGDEDIVFPADAAPALARLTPGAAVERVPDAGHSVYFERPQRFNGIVDGFLARVLRR
jgi:3-oxoadipate enol-lactonase